MSLKNSGLPLGAMFDILMGNIADHWIIATYFGTMIFNENAILAAFSLSVGSGWGKYLGIALVAGMGTLSNDLILYTAARFGLIRFFKRKDEDTERGAKTFFEKVFLRNIFLSILLLKFLFGMRTLLTLYIVTKKGISFPVYLFYDFCAVIFYIIVLALLGWFIGIGIGSTLGVYNMVVKAVLIVVVIIVFTHLIAYVLRKVRKTNAHAQTLSK